MMDLLATNPLHRHQLVNGTAPDALRHALIDILGAHEVDFGSNAEHLRATVACMPLKHLDLIFSQVNIPIRVQVPGIGMVKQQIAVAGCGRTAFAGTQFDVNTDETAVIPAGVAMVHNNQAGLTQFVFRIHADALQTKLSALLGTAVFKDIAFDTRASFTYPELRRLRRTLKFVIQEIDREDSQVPAPTLEEFEQMLLVCFLMGNRHNFTDHLQREPRAPAPWQVRLVEEHIEANWNKPITVEALAAVTGGSARSIFKAFKETRGSTPMAFVKNVRLEHARRMLQTPEDKTSVLGVAYACGFLNSGHFARDYRIAFGELPSATLARARRRRT
jgi:AraC-like DNA-binding protein